MSIFIAALTSWGMYSDTSFSIYDYNVDMLKLADEINPGQFNVSDNILCLC